jgi:threonine aldolase
MTQTIDLRSDTVTQPSQAMREAMARAPVGDDVYGEDPTINRLQELAADRIGVEAALYVPSGTMANQIAIRAHTQHGDALIAAAKSHMFLYESGGAAALSGVQPVLVGDDGFFTPDDLREAIFPPDDHFPATRLVCIENTHNASGGRVWAQSTVREIADVARDAGLALHLDGARIFNASAASGVPVAELAAPFDSVSFCLSKGLGAPVGSLVCGSRDFIVRAHRYRKMFGGGMRQAGILAAAGIYALEHNVKRLEEDHENARRLARGLAALPGVQLVREPESNLVFFRVPDVGGFVRAIQARGLLINAMSATALRAVTHLDVSSHDIDRALEIIGELVA